VTILCCDIRGFTSLSENLDPGRLIGLINRLYERIIKVVETKMGVIDKFLGDAILCIFEGEDSAQRSVDCGVDILGEVKSFNDHKEESLGYPIQIGIGIHRGPVILGTIGSFERMDSTVLGLTVNLTKRLEELTRILGIEMLISDEVANLLPNGHTHRLRRLGEALIRGSVKPLTLFEVYDQDGIEIRNLKDRIGPIVNEGIEIFKRGLFYEALSLIEKAQKIYPKDIPTQLLITAIRNSIKHGVTDKKSIMLDLR
jgi:class 3 adenylate cyclase